MAEMFSHRSRHVSHVRNFFITCYTQTNLEKIWELEMKHLILDPVIVLVRTFFSQPESLLPHFLAQLCLSLPPLSTAGFLATLFSSWERNSVNQFTRSLLTLSATVFLRSKCLEYVDSTCYRTLWRQETCTTFSFLLLSDLWQTSPTAFWTVCERMWL